MNVKTARKQVGWKRIGPTSLPSIRFCARTACFLMLLWLSWSSASAANGKECYSFPKADGRFVTKWTNVEAVCSALKSELNTRCAQFRGTCGLRTMGLTSVRFPLLRAVPGGRQRQVYDVLVRARSLVDIGPKSQNYLNSLAKGNLSVWDEAVMRGDARMSVMSVDIGNRGILDNVYAVDTRGCEAGYVEKNYGSLPNLDVGQLSPELFVSDRLDPDDPYKLAETSSISRHVPRIADIFTYESRVYSARFEPARQMLIVTTIRTRERGPLAPHSTEYSCVIDFHRNSSQGEQK